MRGLTDQNPRFILLATDGLPNCAPGTSDTAADDSAGAVMAVADAAAMGIPTFVVGVATGGMGTADTTLSNMANAGGYPRAGSPTYYNVSSTAEFVAVLQTLVGMAASCTFTVPDPPNTDTDRAHIGVIVERQGAHEGHEPRQRLGLHEHRHDGRSGVWFDVRRDHERIREVRRDRLQVHHQLTPEVPMRSSIIVRVGALCVGLVVVGCGFSPGKARHRQRRHGANTGAGVTGIGNFGGSSTTGQGGLTGQGGDMACATFPKSSSKLPPDILIVLDASGSMNEDATNTSCGNAGCGATSKWALMTPAINQVVNDTQTDVNWGLKFFADMGNTCGVNATTVAVNIATTNADRDRDRDHRPHVDGRNRRGGVLNGSRTPTRGRENAAVTYLTALADGDQPEVHRARHRRQPELPGDRQQRRRRLGRRDRRGHRREDGRYPDVRRRHRDRRRHGRHDAEHDGGRGRLSADGRGDAVLLRCQTRPGSPRCCARWSAWRRPASSRSRRRPRPTGRPAASDIAVTGQRQRHPDTGIPQDATNGWTYSDSTHDLDHAARIVV